MATGRFEKDQRAALFGSKGPRNRGGGAGDDHAAAVTRELMERQNDSAIDDLEGKVSQLRELTSGLSSEIKSSHGLLDLLGIDVDKAGSLLKGTVGQLRVMMQGQGSRSMCSIVGFVVALFLLLYFLGAAYPSTREGEAMQLAEAPGEAVAAAQNASSAGGAR